MIYSDNSRCKKFNLKKLIICSFVKIVMLFLMNLLKLLLIVVKKDSLIENQIFPIAKTVKNLFTCKYFLKTNQHCLAACIFLKSNRYNLSQTLK